ncbi:alpha/beta fold hydrolase [Clostridium beijerinckii]|uniref:alpha/beta fold hydrolase n=1 Tax=Clostridium beijerinckii TaxID=1520 RepID=UPI00047D76C4|nr:alpha/beta hydrolase [Clostridium beijerinckii]
MTKPYLIMLPGWGMNSLVWNEFDKLLSNDFELVFIEWDNVFSLNQFKEKVINVIEQKQISTFSILGWSLGSLVAQDIASDNLFNIKNLILVGCTSSFIQHNENGYNIGLNKKIVERMKSKLYKNPQETLYDFYDAMFSKEEKLKNYNNEFLQTMKSNTKNQSIDSLSLGLDYLIQKDLRTKLFRINVPLLIIQGEDDNICPLKGAEYIKNMSANSNIEIIRAAGHIPFFTNPNVCYNIISEFTSKNI